MTTKQKIDVMMASADGAKIEYKRRVNECWQPANTPTWDWLQCEYRVAKPKLTCFGANCSNKLDGEASISTWTDGAYCSKRCAYIADVMWAFKQGSK